MAKEDKKVDMLHGPLAGKIIVFALPLIASGILQQSFNAVDVAMVGHYSTSSAIAAVGSNGPIISILVNLFLGVAVGANVEITEIPGYLPILKQEDLDNLMRENLKGLGLDASDIVEGGDFTGSFDFGDISHLMPAIHPMFGGVTGALHTRDFEVVDPELACIIPAKAMAMTIIDLLYDDAKEAKDILAHFKPVMTKEEYLSFLENNDRTITLK